MLRYCGMVSDWIAKARAFLVEHSLDKIRVAGNFRELQSKARVALIDLGHARQMQEEGHEERLMEIFQRERNFWKAEAEVISLAREYLERYIK